MPLHSTGLVRMPLVIMSPLISSKMLLLLLSHVCLVVLKGCLIAAVNLCISDTRIVHMTLRGTRLCARSSWCLQTRDMAVPTLQVSLFKYSTAPCLLLPHDVRMTANIEPISDKAGH